MGPDDEEDGDSGDDDLPPGGPPHHGRNTWFHEPHRLSKTDERALNAAMANEEEDGDDGNTGATALEGLNLNTTLTWIFIIIFRGIM